MRLLHTSDWHLGQHFFGKSRQAEHAALLAWLLEQVVVQAVDAVVVAGDVFDTASPPSHANPAPGSEGEADDAGEVSTGSTDGDGGTGSVGETDAGETGTS